MKNTVTTNQRKEINVLDYFSKKDCDYSKVPYLFDKYKILEDDNGICPEVAYFKITDAGERNVKTNNIGRLFQLLDAQKWRLRHCDMYEQGVLDGSVTYIVMLQGVSKEVMGFLSKTMFKGSDKKLIENIYKELNNIK